MSNDDKLSGPDNQPLGKYVTEINPVPLSDTLQTDPLDADHFDIYKEKILTLLNKIDSQLPFVLGAIIALPLGRKDKTAVTSIFHDVVGPALMIKDYHTLFHSVSTSKGYKVLSTLCHDFGNIILSIRDFISHPEGDDSSLTNFVRTIMSQIKILRGELSYLSYSAENLLHIDQFSPTKNVDDIIDQLPNMTRQDITITNNIPALNILSYQKIFNTVVHNLITNAVKFTPNHGIITIDLHASNTHELTFCIQDSGIGIPDNVDVFAKGYTTVSPSGHVGTGLGLAACKDFLKDIGGNIWHEKGPGGIGTKFLFILPIKKD